MNLVHLKKPRLIFILKDLYILYTINYTTSKSRRTVYRYIYSKLKFLLSTISSYRLDLIEDLEYLDFNKLFGIDLPLSHRTLWLKIIRHYYPFTDLAAQDFYTDTFILSIFDYYYFKLVFDSYSDSSTCIEIKERLRNNRFLFIYEDLLNHILFSPKKRFNIIAKGLKTKISYYFYTDRGTKIVSINLVPELSHTDLLPFLKDTKIYLSGIKDYERVSKLSFSLPLLLRRQVYLLDRAKSRFYYAPFCLPRVPKQRVEVVYLPKAGYNPQAKEFVVVVAPNGERLDSQLIYLLNYIVCQLENLEKIKFIVLWRDLGIRHYKVEYRNLVYVHSIMEVLETANVLLDLYRHNHMERLRDCYLNGIFPVIFVRRKDITTELAVDYLKKKGYKKFLYNTLEGLIGRILELYWQWVDREPSPCYSEGEVMR